MGNTMQYKVTLAKFGNLSALGAFVTHLASGYIRHI